MLRGRAITKGVWSVTRSLRETWETWSSLLNLKTLRSCAQRIECMDGDRLFTQLYSLASVAREIVLAFDVVTFRLERSMR